MTETAPKLFDVRTLALRRARARWLAVRAAGEHKADFLLDLAVEDIVDRLSFITRSFRNVLVLGQATAALLASLRARTGSDGSVTIIDPGDPDFSPGGDVVGEIAARLADKRQAFDLVVSPLALHVVDDLPGVLALARNAMEPDGLLIANMLGGETLAELRSCLMDAEMAVTGGASARVHPMIDVRTLGALLQRAGFALPVADSDVIDTSYRSSLDLMADLRAMGRTNVLRDRPRRFLRRMILADVEALYRDRFPAANGSLRATFEMVTGTGWVPHQSQQKPLKPGSAVSRLADALKPRAPESD